MDPDWLNSSRDLQQSIIIAIEENFVYVVFASMELVLSLYLKMIKVV